MGILELMLVLVIGLVVCVVPVAGLIFFLATRDRTKKKDQSA